MSQRLFRSKLILIQKNLLLDAAVVFIMLSIICLFFLKLFYPQLSIFATQEIGVSDIWYLNYPLKYFLHESLSHNHLPSWNSLMGAGSPVLAEGEIGTYNFYNLISFKFLPPIIAFNLGYIVTFSVAVTGMYFLSKRYGFSQFVAFYVAILFGLSGFFIAHISHFNLVQTAAFLPFLFLFTDMLLTKPSITSTIFLGVTLSQQIFSGSPQMVFISLCGLFLYVIYRCFSLVNKHRRLGYFISAVLLGVILSAAQIWPSLELLLISNRNTGLNISELLYYKFPASHLLTFIFPFVFGNPQTGTYPHFNDIDGALFWENAGYIGIVPLLLFAFSFLRNNVIKLLKIRLFSITLLIFSFLFMLGGNSPIYFLLTLYPFSFFRFPSRFVLLFIFALLLLAGSGLSNLLLLIKNSRRRQIAAVIISGLSLINIFTLWINYHPVIPYTAFSKPPEILEHLNNVGNIYTYSANARAWQEFFQTGSMYPTKYIDLKNELAPNINLLYKIGTSNAYSSSFSPKRLSLYNSLTASNYELPSTSTEITSIVMKVLSMRNTSHIVSPVPLTNTNLLLLDKIHLSDYGPETFLYIYKNAEALPKYSLVGDYAVTPTLEEFVKIVSSQNFDPRNQVLIERDISLTKQDVPFRKPLPPVEEKNNLVKLSTDFSQASILHAVTSYYPGWEALIDNQPAEVFPVNVFDLGVRVPEGKHTVTLVFNPQSIKYGLLVSIASYTLVLLVIGRHLSRKIIGE